MDKKIGLLVGREWSFPPAFIEEVNGRKAGVTAEYITLDITRMAEPSEYAVIIDRISHEVGFYRAYLKHASLLGTKVVNNPFMWSADDKFFDATLATTLGVASPKTVVLPNKDYIPGISHSESLRNLKFPMDWKGAIEYVGLPCVLKDAHGGGWRDVYICNSLQEVWKHYNESGLLTMVLQEFIEWDKYIRCLCLGQEYVLPMQYDPKGRRYIDDPYYLSPDLRTRIVDDALALVTALGYDMNSVEFAVRGDVPYAIDFMNPAPDMDINSLTKPFFDWTVKHMADMAIKMAKAKRKSPQAAKFATVRK